MKSLEDSVRGERTGDASGCASERSSAVLRRFWGYESLRPLQAEAIQAGSIGATL